MQATSELKKEHQAAMLMLEVLDKVSQQLKKGKSVEVEHLDKILDFFSGFVDHCHHGKEEKLLIPGLKQTGNDQAQDQLKDILAEHEQGRQLIKNMKVSLRQYRRGADRAGQELAKNAQAYIELLTAHIAKEDGELFPLADKLLTESEQGKMKEGFDRIEEQEIGNGKHEEYHQLLKKFKGMYLLD